MTGGEDKDETGHGVSKEVEGQDTGASREEADKGGAKGKASKQQASKRQKVISDFFNAAPSYSNCKQVQDILCFYLYWSC